MLSVACHEHQASLTASRLLLPWPSPSCPSSRHDAHRGGLTGIGEALSGMTDSDTGADGFRAGAVMVGSWRMTEPPEVCTELANPCVPTTGCERPLK